MTESSPPPSSEQAFVNRLVSSFIQWAPLGGSGFAFASFLLQQDWVTSVLLFPVTAVSGVWAAYSKNFIEQLSKIYGERGREDANALVRSLDSLNEALKWQFSGFEGRYLKLQAQKVSEYLTEGFNPDRTAIPLLEEVYVPLELSGSLSQNFAPKDRETDEPLWIWDFIRRSQRESQFRQMVIQAKGGFGKTTLLRHLAWIYGQGKYKKHRVAKRIPFLLHLRDWREPLTDSKPPSLANLITQYVCELDPQHKLKIPPDWIDQTLNGGDALVMLDGFDEIPEDKRGDVSYWISSEMRTYPRSTFILTSRPEGFKQYESQKPRVPLFVQKFTPEQQSDFVHRWYRCQESCFRSPKQVKLAHQVAEQNAKNLLG